jgi:hypothetical protein
MKRARQRRVVPRLVYDVAGFGAFFAELKYAERLPRLRQALATAKSWEAFRRMAPRDDYRWIIRSFDESGEKRPKGSDPFCVEQLPSIDDAPPPWPREETRKVLPHDLLNKYCEREEFLWFARIETLQALIDELQSRGFVVERRSDLTLLD